MTTSPRPRMHSLRGGTFASLVVVGLAILAIVLPNSYASGGCHSLHADNERWMADNYEKHLAIEAASQDSGSSIGLRVESRRIYEGGVCKVIPKRGSLPCNGPNCRPYEKLPETSSTPTGSSLRLAANPGNTGTAFSDDEPSLAAWLSHSSDAPFAGYPHEHEYPP